MKFPPKSIIWVISLLGLAILFTRCDSEEVFLAGPINLLIVDQNNGYSKINFDFARTTINNMPYELLSKKEEEGMRFIREEEKVVRDFLFNMYDTWKDPVFQELSRSESTHFATLIIPLEKYLIDDPADQSHYGQFESNSHLAFFEFLNATGTRSIESAYRALGLYQEANYISLKNQLEDITNNQDLKLLYDNLMVATRNHLRIAVRQYEALGQEYTPQVLSSGRYNDIIQSGWERNPMGE